MLIDKDRAVAMKWNEQLWVCFFLRTALSHHQVLVILKLT